MADFLGYLSQFVTDANLVVPLHDPAQGVYVEGIMLPSIAYRTNLTPLASGAIHDADGNQRSKFDVATIDHVMVIKKSNLATLADFYNAKLLAAAKVGGVALLVDVKNELVTGWYEAHGALPLLDAPRSLLVSLAAVEATLKVDGGL